MSLPKLESTRGAAAQTAHAYEWFAKSFVLSTESEADFCELLQGYLDRFQPADTVEASCVLDMVAAQWQLIRCESILKTTLELQLHDQESGPSCLAQIAAAFEAESKTLSQLLRHMSAHRRAYQESYKTLRSLQNSRPSQASNTGPAPEKSPQRQQNTSAPPETVIFKNEPKPKVENLVSCHCGRTIAEPALRNGYRCRCGYFHKPRQRHC